jgi:hypothetical protein
LSGRNPAKGSRIPGIRKWPQEYLPKIYDPSGVDELVYVSQADAEDMCRRLAREEGIFAGISAAGACWVAQQVAQQVENATIAFIVCDRATVTCPPACSHHASGRRRGAFVARAGRIQAVRVRTGGALLAEQVRGMRWPTGCALAVIEPQWFMTWEAAAKVAGRAKNCGNIRGHDAHRQRNRHPRAELPLPILKAKKALNDMSSGSCSR